MPSLRCSLCQLRFFLCLLCLSCLPLDSALFARVATAPQRLAPPPGLPCSRDHLTSFTGKVLRYQRTARQIFLIVRTDEETTERFQIAISKGKNYGELFLLNGQPIEKSDLAKIEKTASQKTPAVRVTVWACRNSSHRIIDWRVATN